MTNRHEIEGTVDESGVRKQRAIDATQALLAFPGQHVARVVLFGSVAREQAVPESDIDLCVVLEEQSGRDVLWVGGLLRDHLKREGFSLGVHLPMGLDLTIISKAHFRELSGLPPHVRERLKTIKTEGIVLYPNASVGS